MKHTSLLLILVIAGLLLAACAGAADEDNPAEPVASQTSDLETPVGLPATIGAQATLLPATANAAITAEATQTQAGEPASATPSPGETGGPAAAAATETTAPSATAQPPVQAQEFPNPDGYTWQLVSDGLESPVGLDHAGDGSGRLFVLEQKGRIRLLSGGELLPEPFLDITDRVGSGGNEQGLLGIAFHPQFAETGLFYVNYTDANGNTQIARFSVSPDDPNRADPDSETQVLFVEQPYSNHNGGSMAFGPDNLLYLGLGDGGAAGDPHGNGQATGTLLGKILRIDVAGAAGEGGQAYAIPQDNPFVAGGGAPEIWVLGLRNPWRFSFDRLTGDLYIGDVGQGEWEEIDVIPAGSAGGMNFGWNIMEGMECFGRADCSTQGLFLPVAVTGTHADGGCAVTGGYVYRGPSLPEWQGIYLFADFCNGLVWGLRPLSVGWDQQLLFQTPYRITSFGEDEAGEIYLLDRGGGVYRLESAS